MLADAGVADTCSDGAPSSGSFVNPVGTAIVCRADSRELAVRSEEAPVAVCRLGPALRLAQVSGTAIVRLPSSWTKDGLEAMTRAVLVAGTWTMWGRRTLSCSR